MQLSVTFTCDLDSVATLDLCLSRATVTTQRIPVSTHIKLDHYRPTTETQFECRFACVLMVVRDGMLAGIIGVAPITQLRTCVIKIETFKGGHLMW